MYTNKRLDKVKNITVIILILFTSIIFCQNNQDSISKNPYESIIKNLKSNNIVMLADFQQHHSMLPNLSLIQTINEWIKKSRDNDKLTVILEQSEDNVNSLNKFIEQDKIEDLLDNCWEEFTIEDLYLYANLKNIIRENKSKIKIRGFEKHFTGEILFTRTEREKDLWFVNERDSVLAERIEKYVEQNPNEQILIFYGGAHLIDKYVSKKGATVSLSENESYGYFIAHYLKEYYGNEKVITYNQISLTPEFFEDKEVKDYASETFLIKANHPALKQASSDYYNWTIVRNQNFKMPTPIRYIFCKSNLERFWEVWSQFEKWNNSYNKNIVNGNISESIRIMTGRYFQFIGDYRNWISKNSVGLERISSEEFSQDIFNQLNNNPKSYEIRKRIFALGSGPGFMNTEYLPTKEEWNKEVWPTLVNHFKFLNAVGILWIGSDEEKGLAKEFLLSLTQQDYNEPQKYLEYWYSHFYNYKF